MLTWEINAIRSTFKRCFGLQYAITKAFEGKDTNYQKECIKTLANQSGMGYEFLSNHIKEIISL